MNRFRPRRRPPSERPTLHVVDLAGLVVRSNRFGSWHRRRNMGRVHRSVVRAYAVAAGLTERDCALLLDLDASLDDGTPTLLGPGAWPGEGEAVSLTPEWCAVCFEHVVVGSSGDRLVPWVGALAAVGLPVTVVHRPGLVSPDLAALAHALVPLPRFVLR